MRVYTMMKQALNLWATFLVEVVVFSRYPYLASLTRLTFWTSSPGKQVLPNLGPFHACDDLTSLNT